MAPNVWLYQLLLVALVLICFLLHGWWPDHQSPTPRTPCKPDKPRRKRSAAPQPFPGLIHKPLCTACEQGVESRPPAPGPLPPVILFTQGRRRMINTQQHFCPKPDCASHGWLGLGNIRANGHPGGQPWRQVQCVSCHGYFSETPGTIFHGKRASVELIVRVVACLAEGLGIRGTARVFEIDPHTVLQWLVEGAEQLQAFSAYFLHKLHVNQVQLAALYAVLSAVRGGEISEAEAIERLSRSPHWVWTAIDPETKLLLSVQGGERTLAMAQRVVHHVTQLLTPDCAPLFLTDGFREYMTALLTHYGHWVQQPRRQATGPLPKPRWLPLPQWLDAQVVKTVRRRRLVEVKHRVVFGAQRAIEQVWATCGWQINTSFGERRNLSLRQRVAAMRRRSATSCKGEDGLHQQLTLFQVDHNFVLPHASLRQALAEPVSTNGRGSAKVWRPCTPAMAAGLTAHVGSLREVLMFRVPPWPQPQTV